eukprot:67881-Rhodomonas_salina.2
MSAPASGETTVPSTAARNLIRPMCKGSSSLWLWQLSANTDKSMFRTCLFSPLFSPYALTLPPLSAVTYARAAAGPYEYDLAKIQQFV